MAKGTGLVKSKARYLKLINTFPERADFYRERIAKVEEEIVFLKVCRRCGRPLKDVHAQEIGYGKECQAQALAELEAHLNDDTDTAAPSSEGGTGTTEGAAGGADRCDRDRTDWLRTVGEGHSSGVPSGEGLDEAVIR